MSVLKCLFNPSVSQESPVFYAEEIVNEYDEKGNPLRSVKRIDDVSILESNGFVEYWSLDALLKAGINPQNINVTTSANNRIQGQISLDGSMAEASAILDSVEFENK